MKSFTAVAFAAALAFPALGNAGPPDDLERHRTTLEQLRAHPQASAAGNALAEMSHHLDEARARWQQGDRRALAASLTRLDAQTALVRARLDVAAARTQLAETRATLEAVRVELDAERARHEAIRARIEGGE